ncbi:hypothetical protein QL285_046808 [Trifolium repens]|nr:hypothetical protein QL285_046808 [Trifolium repens]
MPNMKKGVSPTTIPILYVSESLSLYFCKHIAIFIKTFFKTQNECNTTNLNNASETAARSLWIRNHSRHLECELLLNDRLMHLPECSQYVNNFLLKHYIIYIPYCNIKTNRMNWRSGKGSRHFCIGRGFDPP